MNTKRIIPALTAALFLVVAGAASPASASATEVSGTLTCPVGQTLYVHVTTQNPSTASFYLAGSLRYTQVGGSDHWYNYGTRGGAWKVTSTGILTVSDGCQSGTFAPLTAK